MLLFPRSKVNDSVPSGCDNETAFLVDASKLRYLEELICDETGKYLKSSRPKCTIILDENDNVESEVNTAYGKAYTLVQKYYKHKDTPNFQRTMYELHKKENVHPICMICYEWRGDT